jgi:hypothetical protein
MAIFVTSRCLIIGRELAAASVPLKVEVAFAPLPETQTR